MPKPAELPIESGLDAVPVAASIAANVRERLESALRDSKAPATRRAYKVAWSNWEAWADSHGAAAMPAEPAAVAAHLAQRAESVGLPSLSLACAAIGAAHDLAGLPNPCVDRIVKTAMKGFARQSDSAPRQAAALDAEAVAAIRGAINGKADTCARAARDLALIQVLSDAGLRRSEAAALVWADFEEAGDGSGRLTIRRSKTDQEGDGAVVAVTARAVDDLAKLALFRVADADAPIFGLSGSQIGRVVKARAKEAGLSGSFSGHSGRVGTAVRMTRAGAPAQAVMRQGRWKSTRMVARYTRKESAGEALRYL